MATLDNKMSENLLSSRHLVLMFVAVLANSLALSNGSATRECVLRLSLGVPAPADGVARETIVSV